MNEFNLHIEMISKVAEALGDLLDKVVFVGGCVTGLLITDEFTREKARHTDDVDLIVDVVTRQDLVKLEGKLRLRGFKNRISEDAHIGSWSIGQLNVDIIPANTDLLATSGWCEAAYHHSGKMIHWKVET